jgi:hypothetical protein
MRLRRNGRNCHPERSERPSTALAGVKAATGVAALQSGALRDAAHHLECGDASRRFHSGREDRAIGAILSVSEGSQNATVVAAEILR